MKTAKSAGKRRSIYNEPLSTREVKLLAGWERERRVLLTVADLRAAVGPRAAADVARRLVAKHALERVARGQYLLRPFRSMARPTSSSAVLLAAAAMQGTPYYVGGLWALTFHRLTDQQYVSVIDVFVAGSRRSRAYGGAQLKFHRCRPEHLRAGVGPTAVEGVEIPLSGPERTLVDLLDNASLAGSAAHALRLVEPALPRAEHRKLAELAVEVGSSSTCQRLGVLLERAGASGRLLGLLLRRAAESRSMLSLVAGERRTGPFNKRWGVVENDR